MRFKNAKYTFVCNREVREEFKALCKLCGLSPSDMLQEVMIEFNENTKKIAKMKDVSEVRSLLQEKMDFASNEIQYFEEHRNIEE